MSEPGQQTPSSTGPVTGPDAPVEDTRTPAAPVGTPPEESLTPSDVSGTPFEITAGDDDPAFRIAEPEPGDPAAASPPSKARTVVLSSLLVIALAGLGTVGWFGWRVNSERHTTLSTPTTIGSLTLDDSEQATATADYLQTALSAEISMDKAVGAVYSGGDDRTVLFFGGTTLLWSPGSDLDSAFDLVSDDQSAVTGLKEVDAGDLSGTMKCGVAKSDDGDLTVCGWADHGSLALAMFADRTEAEAAPLMRELRSAIQTRS